MEYYVYIIIVFAVVLKLGFYLCWYQSRRQRGENTTQMRVVMPDGSIRVMTVASGVRGSGQPVTADTLYQYDNPVIIDGSGVVQAGRTENHEPSGQLPRPPSYTGQPETKQSTGLPPSYSAIFSQTGSPPQASDNTSTEPAVLPTVSYTQTESGFIIPEGVSPPPYTPTPVPAPTVTSQAPTDNTTAADAEVPPPPSAAVTAPPETAAVPVSHVTPPLQSSSQPVAMPATPSAASLTSADYM